jgi:hypothetical protein
MINLYEALNTYKEEIRKKHNFGPPGAEVFDDAVVSITVLFNEIEDAFTAGVKKEHQRQIEEDAANWRRLQGTIRYAELTVPWWRRWFGKKPQTNKQTNENKTSY